MNFYILKPILLLFCGLVFLHDFACGRLHINNDGIVGINQDELVDYMTKAIKGFQKVMLQGDDELKYPIMDPYEVEDISFDFDDPSSSKKYRLNFINTNETIIKGLSDYQLSNVQVKPNSMTLYLGFMFNDLQTKFAYKVEGHMFKNIFPVYGEGLLKLSTKGQGMHLTVILNIDHGFIVVEDAYAYKYYNDIDIKITGLMDLPSSFASAALDDVLEQWMNIHGWKVLNKYVLDVVEQAIGGMTKEEFSDYLDHFVKKYDQQ